MVQNMMIICEYTIKNYRQWRRRCHGGWAVPRRSVFLFCVSLQTTLISCPLPSSTHAMLVNSMLFWLERWI